MLNTDNSLPFDLLAIVINTHPQPITNSTNRIAPSTLVYAEVLGAGQESSYVFKAAISSPFWRSDPA